MKKALTAAVFLFAAFAVPAFAVDFSAAIAGVDGKPMTLDNTPNSPPATLSMLAINALNFTEQGIDATEKVRRFKLAVKISEAKGDTFLSPEDIVLLKKVVGLLYSPIVVGRAYELLEAPAKAQEPKK